MSLRENTQLRPSMKSYIYLYRVFISQIASHLVTFNLSSMLFLIKVRGDRCDITIPVKPVL